MHGTQVKAAAGQRPCRAWGETEGELQENYPVGKRHPSPGRGHDSRAPRGAREAAARC